MSFLIDEQDFMNNPDSVRNLKIALEIEGRCRCTSMDCGDCNHCQISYRLEDAKKEETITPKHSCL